MVENKSKKHECKMRNVNKDVKCKNFTLPQLTSAHSLWLCRILLQTTPCRRSYYRMRSCGASTVHKVAI